jgi:type IV secretion system protein VirB6
MQMITRQIILAIVLVLTVSVSNAYASTFGESCTTLPRVDDSGYLVADTAYGYIKQSIDMKTYVTDGCSDEGTEFKFCIKNQSGSAEPCEQASIAVGSEALLGSLSSNPDIGGNAVLKQIVIGTEIIEGKACITMPTSRGPMPLMCRYLSTPLANESLDAVCRNIDESCYETNTKTQSLISFSGITVHCLRNTLDKILYVGMECPAPDEENVLTSLRPFAGFQEAMKMAVRAALILYVMVYGFKIVMNNEYTDFNKIALFLVKFLFVVYFAVGLGEKTLENGQTVSRNGVTELGLPIFAELTTSFAEIVFFAGGSQGLCRFDADKYEDGYTFYRLWDAIDCRVGYYLGMQALYNIGDAIKSMSGSTDSEAGKAINFTGGNNNAYGALSKAGAFSYFIVMCGLFLNGNIIAVIMGLVFVVLFMSVLMYFFTAYLICLITLYVMAYLAPIFVPMVLFERTKSYFDSWVKVVVSCMLQPAVIAGFIAMLLTMYDSAIYGNCEFQRYDYVSNGFSFSTFELRLPDAEESECTSSMGYKLLSYYNGVGWEGKDMILFTLYSLKDTLDMLSSLIYVVIYMIVFYFFIQSVNEFASDLTGGPNLSAVTASPTAIVDQVMAAASAMAKRGGGKGETAEKKDAPSAKRAGVSQDKASTGGVGEVADKASTGGSGE